MSKKKVRPSLIGAMIYETTDSMLKHLAQENPHVPIWHPYMAKARTTSLHTQEMLELRRVRGHLLFIGRFHDVV